jgi:hypothetical protein
MDFFISYTGVDRAWAEWIAFVLEEHEYAATLQAWDFRPGGNFAIEMQKAASQAERTIAVLSPDYLKSGFAEAEWSAVFAQDPKGNKGRLVPIIVRRCELSGLLKAIIHIDLSNYHDEAEAKLSLLKGVSRERAKPNKRPPFPGQRRLSPVSFPGSSKAEPAASQADYLPELRHPPTDFEKRQYNKLAFELTQARFRTALVELSRRNSFLSYEIESETTSKFTVEVFSQGDAIFGCRVWQGSLHSREGISYAAGRRLPMGNGANEILTISNDQKSIFFSALMGGGLDELSLELDPKRLSADAAAKYLWLRFAKELGVHTRSR